MSRTLMIMAGGTGGHVFPALAVAEALRAEGWQIHWLGTRGRLEEKVVPQHGIPIHYLPVQGLRGHGLQRRLLAPINLLRALWRGWRLMRVLQPDVVLGMGGYASGPGGLAAWLARVPLVIHEQNAAAGLTNRLLAPLAKRVLAGFAGTFGGREQAVGNPLRASFREPSAVSARPWQLLVVGGSLGARFLNETLPAAIAASRHPWQVVHQCGLQDAPLVAERYQQAGMAGRFEVKAFIDDMASAYRASQLVICRAGALTVAELAAVGVASILVPLPGAVDDHQTRNAEVLVNAGAALLAPQASSDAGRFTDWLNQLGDQPQRLEAMAAAARTVDTPQSTAEVVAALKAAALVRRENA